ncbi:hypothetical protein [Desulfotruncus alcoholivorax]|uniref:hypothetical protein n=1 Tax=Desulfotruncus alcoholivorax TaxID=265477 RepID=UPI00040D86FF|nr:hypothetical protein [Desulfotruncus alcoholivorax]
MQRIKDRITLGLIAGLGANLVKEAIAETGVRSGLTKYTCRRMVPLVLLNKKDAKTWKGWFLGTTTDMTIACLTGVLISYTLSLTGKDYGWLKGTIVGNGVLDQVFNAFTRVLPQVKQNPNSNILCRGIHTVFGITAASIITALGDPTLFKESPYPPDNGIQQKMLSPESRHNSCIGWKPSEVNDTGAQNGDSAKNQKGINDDAKTKLRRLYPRFKSRQSTSRGNSYH